MEYDLIAVKYNNYYNRIVRLDSVDDPNPYIEEDVYFNPGDGVNTTHVLDNLLPDKDYLFVKDGLDIVSRWFIIDSRYQLNGQVVVTLRRDLMADYLPEILYAKAYVEKGWLQAENPLIFNTEDMSFNQIKRAEILLKDKTNCPWIVGYYPNNAKISGKAELPNSQYDTTSTYTFLQIQSTINSASGVFKGKPQNQEYVAYFNSPESASKDLIKVALKQENGIVSAEFEATREGTAPLYPANYTPSYTLDGIRKKMKIALIQNYNNLNDALLNAPEIKAVTELYGILQSLAGKRVLFADGKIGFVTFDYDSTATDYTITATTGLSLESKYKEVYASKGITVTNTTTSDYKVQPFLECTATYSNYKATIREVQRGSYNYTFNDEHYTLQDAPYSMFCMPYGAISVTSGSTGFTTSKDIAMAVASSIAETSGNIYDIQILPYCPIGEVSTTYIPSDSRAYDYITETVDGVTKNVGIIIHCQSSSFSKQISILNNVSGAMPSWLQEKRDPIEIKVQDQCEMIRLNSPNYASSWEMSVAKNKGVNVINVSATYMPYQPYIKVYPDFKGLYGDNFNDNRGLILQGDFSIPIVTDQWKTYQLQNKNYENIFNREIKNLDIQQHYGRIQDIVGIGTGALRTAGAGGALANTFGASTGAFAFGTATSALAGVGAGIADYFINDALRDEAKSFKIDMYNMSLDNIKALPNTLTKTTAYTIDNKYFPFIEYYSATDAEKQAFRDKLKYNGCKVGCIGSISDYIGDDLTYVKAQLIRLDGIGDQNLVNNIAGELSKGVYINGSNTTGAE